jgi:hypothetical protein
VVSLETRERELTEAAVRRVAVGAGRAVRLVLGLETADDRRRNTVLAKGLPRAAVKRAAAAIGRAAGDLGPRRIGLAFNILLGGPGTTPRSAVDDAVATARFALETGREAGVAVDLNLHPYYRSARGQAHFPLHRACPPPAVAQAASAVARLAAKSALPCALFIGTNDEGHAGDLVARGRPGWPADSMQAAVERFNRSQDPAALPSCRLFRRPRRPRAGGTRD